CSAGRPPAGCERLQDAMVVVATTATWVVTAVTVAAVRVRRAGIFWGVAAVGAAAVPVLTSNTYYLYLAVTMAITIVVTSGLNVLAGLSGQISLGHAGLYAIGAYSAAIAATRGGLGVWVAVPLGAAITAAVGGLLALAALRVSGPYLAMV